tara:strand:- start:4204 stop:5949 length:1746 start_codon:yes stop_codon:yes gene_type:complete
MKHIYIKLVGLLMVLITILACQLEDNLQPIGEWELSSSTALLPAKDEVFVLDEDTPNELITFSWTASLSDAGYGVVYGVVFVDASSPNYEEPIIEITSDDAGKSLSASISYLDLDTALSLNGYTANSEVSLLWAVVASSLNKSTMNSNPLSVTRFENEIVPEQLFISGTASENGIDLSLAIPLRRLSNSSGEESNIHEVYTSLTAGNTFMFYSEQSLPAHTYGGAEGVLEKNGTPITIEKSGQYRISMDLDNATYSLLKIETWNVKGSPIIGGWDSDEPLEYLGGGVWQATMQFVNVGGFIFRADVSGAGYWDYQMKRVVGTSNEVIVQAQAEAQGLSYEDVLADEKGTVIVTLDLSADAYTYFIEKDPNANGPIETPSTLFLFVNNTMIEEMLKDGDVFTNTNYLALQSGGIVSLNTASDGSGTSYMITTTIGATDSPDEVKVIVNSDLSEGSTAIAVDRDQAYSLSVDFANSKLQWSYYNIFLYHWDEVNQGWDDKDEFLMTYEHPYKFTTTADLIQGYDMKFFSPWDNEFGADDASALSGSMTNKGGSNFKNITTTGAYNVSIELLNDYSTGTYNFEQ